MALNKPAVKLAAAATYGSTTNELLYGLLTGFNCIGYQRIAVDETVAVALTVPLNAIYATLVPEADPLGVADSSRILRFTEDGFTPPTNLAGTDEGMPLGDLSVCDIKGPVNLASFLMIGREAGKTHSVRVQYYG